MSRRGNLCKSGLGLELTWYLGSIVPMGLRMIFFKWINIKSRGFEILSYQTIIRNKLDFYSKDDT